MDNTETVEHGANMKAENKLKGPQNHKIQIAPDVWGWATDSEGRYLNQQEYDRTCFIGAHEVK